MGDDIRLGFVVLNPPVLGLRSVVVDHVERGPAVNGIEAAVNAWLGILMGRHHLQMLDRWKGVGTVSPGGIARLQMSTPAHKKRCYNTLDPKGHRYYGPRISSLQPVTKSHNWMVNP